jgi:transcriptional regulator with XRE-family HTH domain
MGGSKRGPRSDPELKEAIGFRVRHRRKELRLSQTEVARLAGFTSVAMCRIEGGLISPSATSIPRLCRAIQVTPNQLFGWEDQP